MTHEKFTELCALAETGDAAERARAQAELTPYRVKNAVLMAAGYGSRLAPVTDHTPKGLLRVRGEVLVERQIAQLVAAGIHDIILVTGYRSGQFSYLGAHPHVRIVENPDYRRYNNSSTLYRVLEALDNTYICSADNYFTENVFAPYVYRAYYAAVYGEEPTEEYYLSVDADERITGVQIGGARGWYMMGQVYFTRAFSERFRALLKPAYESDVTVREQLWERFYMRHLDKLALHRKCFAREVVHEFDTLSDILAFDPDFVT